MANFNPQARSQAPVQPKHFASYVKTPAVLTNIEQTLGSAAKRETFVAALISAVNSNPALKDCDMNSIISAALLGNSLNLPPSPQLGYFYMVPYNEKAKKNSDGSWTPKRKVAQFQIGYKGYIQLAQRTGLFRKINVTSVKDGEYLGFDPFNEEFQYKLMPNRNELKTVGYYAFFELTNGFRKSIYMSYEDMLTHADTYSKAFDKQAYAALQAGRIPESEQWKYSSFWYKNFDAMAHKTMIRQLISKWAPMSVEMQNAIEMDYATGSATEIGAAYIDADYTENDINEEPTKAIEQDIMGHLEEQQMNQMHQEEPEIVMAETIEEGSVL